MVHDPSARFIFPHLRGGEYQLRVTTSDGAAGAAVVKLGDGENKDGVAIVIEPTGSEVGATAP
jgi:hypothetical protein